MAEISRRCWAVGGAAERIAFNRLWYGAGSDPDEMTIPASRASKRYLRTCGCAPPLSAHFSLAVCLLHPGAGVDGSAFAYFASQSLALRTTNDIHHWVVSGVVVRRFRHGVHCGQSRDVQTDALPDLANRAKPVGSWSIRRTILSLRQAKAQFIPSVLKFGQVLVAKGMMQGVVLLAGTLATMLA